MQAAQRFERVWILVAVIGAVEVAGPPCSAAEIFGRVTTAAGEPAAYVNVIANPRTLTGQDTLRYGAVSDGDGLYRIADVAEGRYAVCVMSRGEDGLDPCEWSVAPPEATVTGKANVSLDVVLEAGRKVRVRIEDPEGLLRTPSRETREATVQAGLWTAEGFFHPLHLVSSDRKGHDFEIVVPFDKDLKLSLGSEKSRILTENGAPVDARSRSLVRAQRNLATPVLRYRLASELERR